MQKAVGMLSEVKESIVNAYEIKTGQAREKISNWMDAETWMNANKAVQLGFADGILDDAKRQPSGETPLNFAFSRRAVTNSLLDKMKPKMMFEPQQPVQPQGIHIDAGKATSADWLEKRLLLIPH
jgi:ATP-dependent Clp protease protease subunit